VLIGIVFYFGLNFVLGVSAKRFGIDPCSAIPEFSNLFPDMDLTDFPDSPASR